MRHRLAGVRLSSKVDTGVHTHLTMDDLLKQSRRTRLHAQSMDSTDLTVANSEGENDTTNPPGKKHRRKRETHRTGRAEDSGSSGGLKREEDREGRREWRGEKQNKRAAEGVAKNGTPPDSTARDGPRGRERGARGGREESPVLQGVGSPPGRKSSGGGKREGRDEGEKTERARASSGGKRKTSRDDRKSDRKERRKKGRGSREDTRVGSVSTGGGRGVFFGTFFFCVVNPVYYCRCVRGGTRK